jgi:hypothetical protein
MQKYSAVWFKILIDNIHAVVCGQFFQQSVGIPMGMNCALFLTDPFLHSQKAECFQKFLHEKKESLHVAFNSTFRYIDDVLKV